MSIQTCQSRGGNLPVSKQPQHSLCYYSNPVFSCLTIIIILSFLLVEEILIKWFNSIICYIGDMNRGQNKGSS